MPDPHDLITADTILTVARHPRLTDDEKRAEIATIIAMLTRDARRERPNE